MRMTSVFYLEKRMTSVSETDLWYNYLEKRREVRMTSIYENDLGYNYLEKRQEVRMTSSCENDLSLRMTSGLFTWRRGRR
jgi:hypothetical protein